MTTRTLIPVTALLGGLTALLGVTPFAAPCSAQDPATATVVSWAAECAQPIATEAFAARGVHRQIGIFVREKTVREWLKSENDWGLVALLRRERPADRRRRRQIRRRKSTMSRAE